ncbi:MAG: 1-deoxy-D-xylulose-5-phosphate reductoisomerase, partial [Peptostreptococcaceae bacterium]|nr:1-deoxy-D-xylulose-5-phosphate reductoisomerase [Peptostreptococcaceae bacterium]
MKRISILGSTGSIGTQTLDVVRKNKYKFEVVAISANRSIHLLLEQINEFKPKYVA